MFFSESGTVRQSLQWWLQWSWKRGHRVPVGAAGALLGHPCWNNQFHVTGIALTRESCRGDQGGNIWHLFTNKYLQPATENTAGCKYWAVWFAAMFFLWLFRKWVKGQHYYYFVVSGVVISDHKFSSVSAVSPRSSHRQARGHFSSQCKRLKNTWN